MGLWPFADTLFSLSPGGDERAGLHLDSYCALPGQNAHRRRELKRRGDKKSE